MIRKLVEKDRSKVMSLLSQEPSINLFIIGDIEAFGFDKDFQEVWGAFNQSNEIEGVLLRYNENFIPYYNKPNFDNSGFKEIILSNPGRKFISGKEIILKDYENLLPNHKSRSTFFCELKDYSNLKDYRDRDIKVATADDAERVYKLLHSIEEFSTFPNSPDRIKHKIEANTGRVYYVENDYGEMISIVQTTAENSLSAMVVGVATLEGYRNRGFMSQCLSKLCADLLGEGKTLCLFYDNPRAGNVYHKLGFKTIDNWVMITE